MRSAISVFYRGNWPDKVATMSDHQVAAIYARMIAQQTKTTFKSTKENTL